MADVPNTVTTLNGLFKTVYADKLQDLVPDFAILQKKLEFISEDKQTGNYYAQPVNLAQEAGFTYNGEAGAVVTLNDAIAGTMKEAQVKGSELILKAQLAYTAISRSATSGTRAFKKATSWKVEDMNNSMRKRLEIAMLYGRSGIGTLSAGPTGQVLTISDATWAGGIWAGCEGHYIDIYQSDLATARYKGIKVASVDSDNKKLTVVGTVTNVLSTDVIYFAGANADGTFNEMAGLQGIITNNTTLFNIDASTYSLWKGNAVSSFGPMSFGKLQDALARAVNKGLMEKVLVLVSPKCWAVLNSDQAALRVFDSSYGSKKNENGSEALTFHGTNGQIEIVSHPFVKDGDSFAIPMETVKRLGSTDVTFTLPGSSEDFFLFRQDKNAVEFQCMTDQAIFLEKPAHAVYMSGITYT